MSLIVGSIIVAEIRIQTVTLRPIVGAYELLFPLHVAVSPAQDPRHSAVISGAEVTVRTSTGSQQIIGFARPDIPVTIRTRKFPSIITPTLRLTLQPQQLTAIEDFRSDGDVIFDLRAVGEGADSQTEHSVQDDWRTQIPRSAWIEEMRKSGAMDILLIEVPMPVGKMADEWREITASLVRARKHFVDGDYHSCVSISRGVIQELGHMNFKQLDWAKPLLDSLASERSTMVKDQREAAILAVVRHYTHQAHHADSEGGITSYSRSEAKLVLTLTAALVARARSK